MKDIWNELHEPGNVLGDENEGDMDVFDAGKVQTINLMAHLRLDGA